MKLSAKQIQKGMQIRVAGVTDIKDMYERWISQDYYSESEKNYFKKCINENKILWVKRGTVKSDSLVYTVLDIHTGSTDKQYHNRRLVVNNDIWLITDKGNMMISTKQEVELV